MFGVYDIIRAQGNYRPDKCAVISGRERYTYKQLNEHINSASYCLHNLGIDQGSRVGMLMYNSYDYIVLFFALLKLGACISPFNFRYTIEELEQLQEQVDCEKFIIGDEFFETVAAVAEKDDEHAVKILYASECKAIGINEGQNWSYRADPAPDDVIFNVFTGGTTGLPKAASHTQQGTLVRAVGYGLNHDVINDKDVYLCYAPLFHIGGIGGMIMTLTAGATFCLLNGFDVDNIISTIAREHVTQISLIPPTILDRFNQRKNDKGLDLSSVRILHMAGGSCDEAVVELAFQLMPEVKLSNGYGMSENGAYLAKMFGKEEFLADKSVILSLGKPQLFYEVKVIKENGQEAKPGETGELYGRGPALMIGYRKHEDSFTEDGWFATGDIMRIDYNGEFHFCARSKDMVKTGGENVYAIEVENAIRKDNDSIAECAVVGLPDKQWGEIVAAAVVLRPDCKMTDKDIIAHCQKYIASYKKPKKVFFLDELPHTGVGKIQKVILKELLMKKSKVM